MRLMARSQPRPTDAELAILGVLWTRGASTVRQVHEALADTRDTGYTTTLKLMQIMAEKGLVKRNETARTHVYSAVAGEEQTQQQLVKDLVDRAFGGSAAQLVLRALSAEGATDAEVKEIRKLIDDYREKR
jgi:BlaI family transcriptional regulator, penicillinase repressor